MSARGPPRRAAYHHNPTTEGTNVIDTRAYKIGSNVVIMAHQDGAHGIDDTEGVIVGFDGQMCGSCHCCPPAPEHQGDGSLCCPGPWYKVAIHCPDCSTTHHLVYAEHELMPRDECHDTECGYSDRSLMHVDH